MARRPGSPAPRRLSWGGIDDGFAHPPAPSRRGRGRKRIATPRLGHHGQHVGLGDDAPRGRDADAVRRAARVPHRLGASHAGADGRVRGERGGAGHRGHHRGRGRRGASAGHGRGADARAGARRAGREPRAEGHGFAALHRADAGRRAGRHAGDRPGGRDQRGAARRRHPRDDAAGAARATAAFRAAQTARVREATLP